MGSVQLGLDDGSRAFITTSPADPGLVSSYTVTVADSAAQTGNAARSWTARFPSIDRYSNELAAAQ